MVSDRLVLLCILKLPIILYFEAMLYIATFLPIMLKSRGPSWSLYVTEILESYFENFCFVPDISHIHCTRKLGNLRKSRFSESLNLKRIHNIQNLIHHFFTLQTSRLKLCFINLIFPYSYPTQLILFINATPVFLVTLLVYDLCSTT